MLRFIARLILIPLGFVLAVLAAAAVFMILGYEQFAEATAIPMDDPNDFIDGWMNMAGDAKIMAAYFTGATILPAIILIIIGEVAKIRSSIYYVVGAGLAMAAMPFLYDLSINSEISDTARNVLPMFATAGFAGGLMYWLVAGRTA